MLHEPPSQEIPRQLGEGLWVLGNIYFNLYLVQGTHKSALIEAGVSGVVDAVIAQLDELGVSPDYLVLTHPHTDHFTGLEGLRAHFPKARLVAATGAREFVSHPKAGPKMIAEDGLMSARLAEIGWQPGRPPIEAIHFPEDYCCIEVSTDINLGARTLRCLPVRGHSPGSIAVHVPELEALMSSDALGFRYLSGDFCPLYFTGYTDYLETIDQLAALKPTRLCPAHQGPLAGNAATTAFDTARQAATTLFERIGQHPDPTHELVEAIYAEYYRETFTLYSEANIKGCMQLLVRRALEARP
jgi:2-aminobenzoylacetyl-CoA thioesterase